MEQSITIKGHVLGTGKVHVRQPECRQVRLRPYQDSIVTKHLLLHPHTLTESPTGSGKSTIMLGFAARKIAAGKRVIIITPKLGINVLRN